MRESQQVKHHYMIDTKLIGYYLHQRGGTVLGMYDKIATLLYRMPKGQVHCAFDVGASTYRKGISPTYKGHRSKAKDKLSEEDKEKLKKFSSDYQEMIKVSRLLPVNVYAVKGVEADDLISIQVEKLLAEANKNNEKIMIYLVTSDMDYKNSVVGRDNVAIMDVFHDGAIIDNDVIKDKDAFRTRREFNIHKSIFGDKSDNIKFMRNLGPVKCEEIFKLIYEQFNNPTDDDVINVIEEYTLDKNRIKVHEHHQEAGRATIREAFKANMLLADTFLDETLMTDEQLKDWNDCLAHEVPNGITELELMEETIKIFGVPIILGFKASKVFGVV